MLLAVPMASAQLVAQGVPPPQDNSEKTAVINFFADVNANSVAMLVGIVDQQMRNGFHKFSILISSTGGETTSAFTAYNYLRGIKAEITTFNVGNVDSAATVIYCAGSKRFALPGTRFLLHGAAVGIAGNAFINAETLESQLALVNNQNQMIVQVMAKTTSKKESDLEHFVRGQTILSPDDAVTLGLVQKVEQEFMGPDSVMVTSVEPPKAPPLVEPTMKILTLPPSQATPQWSLSGKASETLK